LKAIIFNKSVSYCAGGALIMANRKKEMVIKKQINTNLAGPRLLPLKKAADYIGLTVWAMRERIWAGDIPVVQFPGGRKMYVDMQDIEEFIKKNKRVIV
jgi:hypothetical protein